MRKVKVKWEGKKWSQKQTSFTCSSSIVAVCRSDLQTAFDHKKAREEGIIKPSQGMDPEYDEAVSDIKKIEKQLGQYLETQKDALGCRVRS